MKKTSIPRLLLWTASIGIVLLVFMTLMRILFFYRFHPPGTSLSQNLQPVLLGLNFDLRIVCGAIIFPFLIGSIYLRRNAAGRFTGWSIFKIIFTVALMGALLFFMKKGHMFLGTLLIFALIFIAILVWIFKTKNCNPFDSRLSHRIMKGWFILVSVILVFFYALDFEHYDYLQQRLSASIVNFAGDAKISIRMVWETYPVFQLLLFIVVSLAVLIWFISFSFRKISQLTFTGSTGTKFILGIVFTLLLGLAIFGRVNQYPLRWSDAFVFRDDFKSNLALNPVQSFLSTLQFRNSGYDLEVVKKYYPLMAKYLRVQNPAPKNLNFVRRYQPLTAVPKRNVVIVICESFSMYKSTMGGNKLNTTPYFNQMCADGIFFDRCFTPAHGTARGIWATITGIPDVEYPNTSSRNPSYVDQHSIINDYQDYLKYYFIGGSSSWANIRGLLINNIAGLHLLEEQDFNAQKVDVWGISDKRLLLAANDTFARQTKPFAAVIQTADNHRPYTIPEEDKGPFQLVSYPEDTLYKYGFTGNDELNAFRYTDFAFEKFIEAARKEDYFKNTIFVFVGDHGVKGDMSGEYPQSWTDAGLSLHHVPLLFYAPDILKPQRLRQVCSQADLLPSVSALAGISYTNTTMGINLFDSTKIELPFPHDTFIYDPTVRKIGMVTDSFVYNHNLLGGQEHVYPLSGSGEAGNDAEATMRVLATAWYQTAKYLLHHNQKSKVPPVK